VLREDDSVVHITQFVRKEGNMKKALALAAAAAFCTTPAVLADSGWDPSLDEVILINGGEPFFLASGESIAFEVQLDENPSPVIGFSFAGVWAGGGGAWASDTILRITAPDGTSIFRGGFPAPGGGNDWDFQGGGSAADGLYVHGLGSTFGDGNPDFAFDKLAKGGVWTFEFENTWGTAEWKGVSIVLHKQVPAPGALALLGLAGLVGTRRRRA
jgi:hypothetical protein